MAGTNPYITDDDVFQSESLFALHHQLEVFTDCNPTAASCPDSGTPIHNTMPTNQWEFNVSGENPCVSSSPYSGYYLCQNHTRNYYVKVTRRTAATCNSFTVNVTNGI